MQELFFPILAFLIKIITAITAYGCMRLTLTQLDKVISFNFKTWMSKTDDRSKSFYLSARYIGTALFFAILLS